MRVSRLCMTVAAAMTLAAAPLAALAGSFDGQYSGASSVAGGKGTCWGNNPADAFISGDMLTIRYVAYDGTQAPVTATLHPDGSFTAEEPIQGGTISYNGKVTSKRLTAIWKGPLCYGTLDMTK